MSSVMAMAAWLQLSMQIPQALQFYIDAPAGYVTTDQFPYNEYMVHPMNEYVHSK